MAYFVNEGIATPRQFVIPNPDFGRDRLCFSKRVLGSESPNVTDVAKTEISQQTDMVLIPKFPDRMANKVLHSLPNVHKHNEKII